jgi:uncharacterized FAD-dependent dehydrogenase
MIKEIELTVLPENIYDTEYHRTLAAQKLNLNPLDISAVKITRRSIDARRKNPFFRLQISAYINENPTEVLRKIEFNEVSSKKKVIIVGAGPAGLFAALKLIEIGIKPVIYERGKDVIERKKDIEKLERESYINPESNYCFGEGGAGAFSDGKLYTRSTKRGDVNKIINLLIQHGASNDILIDAHPHIGSDRLPVIIKEIRKTILKYGGEIYFNSKVTGFILKKKKISGVIINSKIEVLADSVILAAGHSARDIYYLLQKHNILIESKPFAMGVRIEHPQDLIDKIQYHSQIRHENLPAASYTLKCQVDGKGVYSFCMCPGGVIIPSVTNQGELVLNGMSDSRRNSPYANSGIVVSISAEDWKEYENDGVFAGLMYQKKMEKIAFEAGGSTLAAPAQRLTDFVNEIESKSLPDTSYRPGGVSAPLHEILPENISQRLRKAFAQFGEKMKGYYTEEAQILAAETRTSSPIRIPRSRETLMHTNIEGLYPCGEGSGYTGGILSSAVDGDRCASAAAGYIA